MNSAGRATIATIAREAGVSIPTVSRVLSGRADVVAATRSRVEALLSEHGHRRRGRSGTAAPPVIDLVSHELGLCIPDRLSSVGYDDLAVSRWAGPRLTTIHQPVAVMAERWPPAWWSR